MTQDLTQGLTRLPAEGQAQDPSQDQAQGRGRVAGVLLAAGEGARLGRPKALVRLGGLRLVDRGVRLLRDGGADVVVVVTGAADVDAPGVIIARNPGWAAGMGSSFGAGLAAAPHDCGAAVVVLVDQPLVSPEAVRRLIAAYRAGAELVVAVYQGRRRNPVLLSRRHWAPAVAMAIGDVGARAYLRAHPELVAEVECGDVGSPDDVDTPEDLDRISRLLGGAPRSQG